MKDALGELAVFAGLWIFLGFGWALGLYAAVVLVTRLVVGGGSEARRLDARERALDEADARRNA